MITPLLCLNYYQTASLQSPFSVLATLPLQGINLLTLNFRLLRVFQRLKSTTYQQTASNKVSYPAYERQSAQSYPQVLINRYLF